MKRQIVKAAPIVDAQAGAWIREQVLTRRPNPDPHAKRRWIGPDLGLGHPGDGVDAFALIDACRCMWGPCGYCDIGQHERCAHRLGTAPNPPGVETRIISARHRGAALANVWVKAVHDGTATPCRWVCPCTDCERIGRPLLPGVHLPPPRKRRGPLAQQPLF